MLASWAPVSIYPPTCFRVPSSPGPESHNDLASRRERFHVVVGQPAARSDVGSREFWVCSGLPVVGGSVGTKNFESEKVKRLGSVTRVSCPQPFRSFSVRATTFRGATERHEEGGSAIPSTQGNHKHLI
jgi:hypothetical protein